MHFIKLRFYCICLFVITLGLIISISSRIHKVPYFLRLSIDSQQDSICQLFYDLGNGFVERHSIIKKISNKDNSELDFKLPAKKIYGLRFDPMTSEGSLVIKKISLCGKSFHNGEYKVLHQYELKNLKAVQQIDLRFNKEGYLNAETKLGCIDPIIELPLVKPYDHWKLIDLIDREWVKTFIIYLLLTIPFVVVVSFSCRKKIKIPGKIIFKVNNENHSLNFGEVYKNYPPKYYQDSKEETLRSIIGKMKSGVHWKKAVREEFYNKNEWLYRIVTSPKRTKFLDDYIKPKKLTILDVGAGWGQLSIPLANYNYVCSLEPTPERLEFIITASEQDKVSQNLSFIGADYLDIKFENGFDIILSVGVLEWVGAFGRGLVKPETRQNEFLKKARLELKKTGKLIIGIENRIGLKYLFGANDDHTGLPGISFLKSNLATQKFKELVKKDLKCFTYTFGEYERMLKKAGFSKIRFHVALPDYKLPEEIFPISNNGKECYFNEFIRSNKWVMEHDGSNGKKLGNQDELQSIYQSLAEMDLAHYFAPSFYIEASLL